MHPGFVELREIDWQAPAGRSQDSDLPRIAGVVRFLGRLLSLKPARYQANAQPDEALFSEAEHFIASPGEDGRLTMHCFVLKTGSETGSMTTSRQAAP